MSTDLPAALRPPGIRYARRDPGCDTCEHFDPNVFGAGHAIAGKCARGYAERTPPAPYYVDADETCDRHEPARSLPA